MEKSILGGIGKIKISGLIFSKDSRPEVNHLHICSTSRGVIPKPARTVE